MTAPGIRLQKVLAQAGVGSRRACDDLVASGRVRVNGAVADIGTRVDPATDRIEVDGQAIESTNPLVVFALNKPRGVVTTMHDDQGRPCVGDLVAHIPERLFHVGRLDEDTEGLLLLTNDGDLAHRLMHPSHGVYKTYVARVRGEITSGTVRRLLAGITLPDGPVRADAVAVKTVGTDWSLVELVIHEGRKRIVRRMLKAVGHPVERLTRTAIGDLRMTDLRVGELRMLEPGDIAALLEQ